ncbi:MAG: amino acid ABC transporter permease [Candidatus Heimdallarchaeota archaeon]
MGTVWDYLPYITWGIPWTFGLVFGGLGIGFVLGLPTAISQIYGNKELKAFLDVYVWFFRSVPLLVLLFLFYWGIFPLILGRKLSTLVTSILVLGIRSGAYQSQVFRGSMTAVGEGQYVASRAIGMTHYRGIYHVQLPQALRVAIPGWSNEYAIILKDSAICFTLGVLEILTRTRYVVASTDEILIPYFFAGALFIVLTYGGNKFLNIVYEKTRIPGLVGRM